MILIDLPCVQKVVLAVKLWIISNDWYLEVSCPYVVSFYISNSCLLLFIHVIKENWIIYSFLRHLFPVMRSRRSFDWCKTLGCAILQLHYIGLQLQLKLPPQLNLAVQRITITKKLFALCVKVAFEADYNAFLVSSKHSGDSCSTSFQITEL